MHHRAIQRSKSRGGQREAGTSSEIAVGQSIVTMSLRNIFAKHKRSTQLYRQDATAEVTRLQEKLTRLTVELELERSMRCDAITFADSVKDHRSHSSFANLNDSGEILANGLAAGAASSSIGGDDEMDLQEEEGAANGGPVSSSADQVAAAAAEWKTKLGRSKRALAVMDGGSKHEMDETAEELERLIHDKYDAMEKLKKENIEKDAMIRRLKATVNGQDLKIAELTKTLEKAGIK